MQLQNDGRFRGYAVNVGVAEHGENKILQWSAEMELREVWQNGQWEVIEPATITAFQYLTKKDGSVNESTVKRLRAAFGWDGADPFWFHDHDVSSTLVQVTVKWDTYNGKSRLKVEWIDAGDAVPSIVKKADDATRQRILAQFGPKFRAVSGGTSAMPPVPPRTAPPAPVAPAPVATSGTYEDAWAAFVAVDKGAPSKQQDRWFALLKEQFPGRLVPQDVKPHEWGNLIANMAEVVAIPF
jgi:hypothetical protein